VAPGALGLAPELRARDTNFVPSSLRLVDVDFLDAQAVVGGSAVERAGVVGAAVFARKPRAGIQNRLIQRAVRARRNVFLRVAAGGADDAGRYVRALRLAVGAWSGGSSMVPVD
jgi:hypothetical protein